MKKPIRKAPIAPPRPWDPPGPIQCVTAPEQPDPVHPTGPEPLYFVTHDNLAEREGWWYVRIREWDGAPNFVVAEFFADVVPNASLWARNIATELNELAAQKKDA